MTYVKICGITCEAEIEMLNALKPDFAGFVFAPGRRRLSMENAARLCKMLAPGIQRVGVFVNGAKREILDIKDACGLDILQLHGDEPPQDCLFEDVKIWKAIRIKNESTLADMPDYPTEAYLLDAYAKEAYGGLGKTFDWELVQNANLKKPVILAGGLNPMNIRQALNIIKPYAVDVSSGVETDGKKDFNKIKKFITKVRDDNGTKNWIFR